MGKYLAVSALLAAAPLATHAQAPVATEADVAALRTWVESNRGWPRGAQQEALRIAERSRALVGTRAPFELQAARIAALANNGHSALIPGQWASRYPRSPVRLHLFGDGPFVIAAPADMAELVGARVIRVNGAPWQQVRIAWHRYQGGRPAFRDQFVPLFMELPALLAAAGFGRDPTRVSLDLALANGSRRQVVIAAQLTQLAGEAAYMGDVPLHEAARFAAAAGREQPLYLQEVDRPFRLARIDPLDAYYIRLDATRDVGGERVRDFLAATEAALRARPARHIIVDLRFNMGGDPNTARDFMEGLPTLARGGQLFAITSGRTFSAAISSLGYLKQAAGNRLTIVGEPIGDRLEFWSEGDMVMLPGIGSMLLFARERHNYVTGCPEADCHRPVRDHPIRVRSLDPDLPARLTHADFAAGRDPAMEAIAARIEASD